MSGKSNRAKAVFAALNQHWLCKENRRPDALDPMLADERDETLIDFLADAMHEFACFDDCLLIAREYFEAEKTP